MKTQDGPKIRFVDSLCSTLFYINDGGEIEVENKSTGEMERFECRYIDEYHVRIGDRVYHICEFAITMEQYIRAYRPAKARQQTAE